jgi:hypothetical protein
MPQKTAKPQRRTKKDNALRITIAIFGVFVLAIGLTIFLNVKTQPVCANSISCIKDLSGKPTSDDKGTFMGQQVSAPQLPDKPQYALDTTRAVLGDSTADDKHIYVDLGHQRLYAYQGANLVYNFPISSGKWHPTPTGDFRIWIWLRATRMTGGNKALGTYYDLPNVPYTMYFANDQIPESDGYSLHGAYWHNNFGHPMSHGCVNLRPTDAEQIFYWTNPTVQWSAYPTDDDPGTLITIYGDPPASETDFID